MISRIAARRPITTIMFTLMVIMGGALAYFNLNLALMPDIDMPIAVVSTTYVGAGPEEIQTLISKPLEEALGTVTNLDTISSMSQSNNSSVILQFVDGTNLDIALIDVREILDRVKSSLPDDANDPVILKIDMNAEPIVMGATSKTMDLNSLNTLLEDDVKPRLERIEGVAAVTLSGGTSTEVQLTVDPSQLALYGLSTSSIAQMLQSENLNIPAGNLSQGNNSVNVRVLGEFSNLNEMRYMPITTPTGAMIYLKDIATIEEVQTTREEATYINGQMGIWISIDKQSTSNLVKVTESLAKEMEKLQASYPAIDFYLLSDTAEYISSSISNVTQTALLSAVIAFFVLLVFLKNPITAMIIAVSIPTSIFMAFGLMYFCGMSLNTVSMGGITIGIGMLVDNSIVVLDSIYGYYDKGYSPQESAERGASDVTIAIFASTMTTVAVFLPMAFVQGTVGSILNNLSLGVTFTLLSSLIVSITFVPMACALLFRSSEFRKKKNILLLPIYILVFIWDFFINTITFAYTQILRVSLHIRIFVIIGMVYLFMQTMQVANYIGMDFMESTDEGVVNISISMPNGTQFYTTDALVSEALYLLDEIPETEMIYAKVSEASASITLNLPAKNERERTSKEIAEHAEDLLSHLAGAEITSSASSSAMGDMGGTDITFNIYGYENSVLMEIEKDIIALLESTGHFNKVEGSTGETIPEARVILDREKASAYGISTASIANAMTTAMSGSTATQYKVDGTELDVIIRYDESTGLEYVVDLNTLMISTSNGAKIPLSEVATLDTVESASSMSRENQRNYISFAVSAGNLSTGEGQVLLFEALDTYDFPEGYEYGTSGTAEMMMESFVSLGLCMVIAVLLVYMIMASQFESLSAPFVVMFSMPLAITGGIMGLYFMGRTLTMTAMMGFIMLIGMVVNNAIVLIDYVNQLMDEGYPPYMATMLAGPRRLRPILMTTLTTVLGMVPMAVTQQEGGEVMQGLAIAVIFGMIFSTVVTLVLIPVLYIYVAEQRTKRHSKKAKKLKYARGKEQRRLDLLKWKEEASLSTK